LILKIINVLV
jgi:hypothetical protein